MRSRDRLSAAPRAKARRVGARRRHGLRRARAARAGAGQRRGAAVRVGECHASWPRTRSWRRPRRRARGDAEADRQPGIPSGGHWGSGAERARATARPHDGAAGGGAAGAQEPMVVDVFTWLILMMKEYKDEQAHRRAAIRLMFNTASAGGPLTNVGETRRRGGGGGRRGGRGGAAMAPAPAVAMSWRRWTCSNSAPWSSRSMCVPRPVAAPRFATPTTSGKTASISALLQAAERHQFFQASAFPLPRRAAASELTRRQIVDIGAVVHRHVALFRPNIQHTAQLARRRQDGARRGAGGAGRRVAGRGSAG